MPTFKSNNKSFLQPFKLYYSVLRKLILGLIPTMKLIFQIKATLVTPSQIGTLLQCYQR